MDFTTDKLRSMVRKWQTLIEAHVDVKTTDGFTLRMFCIAFTKKRQGQIKRTAYAQSSQVRTILLIGWLQQSVCCSALVVAAAAASHRAKLGSCDEGGDGAPWLINRQIAHADQAAVQRDPGAGVTAERKHSTAIRSLQDSTAAWSKVRSWSMSISTVAQAAQAK